MSTPSQIVALASVSSESNAPPQVLLADPPRSERWISANAFAALRPSTVSAVMAEAENGYPERLMDLYEWIVEHDAQISAEYESVIASFAGVPWTLDPGKTGDAVADGYADAAVDFARTMLEQIPDFESKLALLGDAVGKGFSVQEKMWGRRGGAWHVTDLLWRHPRRFAFDEQWKLGLYDQGIYGTYGKPLDPNKFVVHMPAVRASYPTRAGTLRTVVYLYMFKRWASAWWAEANEKFGAPIPIGKVPANTKLNVRQDLRSMLERISQGQAAVIDLDVELETLNAANYTGAQYKDFLAWCDEQISKALRGTNMATDIGANGSRAQADVGASSTIAPRIQRYARSLATTVERQIIGNALAFNLHLFGGRMPPIPRFRFLLEGEEKPQITPLVVQEGAVSENELRLSVGLEPRQDPQSDMLLRERRAANAPAIPSAGGAPAALPFQQSQRGAFSRSPTSSPLTSPLAIALSGQSANRSR